MDIEVETTLVGSEAVLEITNDHRVDSLSDAVDFMESGGDFVFFPLDSISVDLALKVKKMVELSNEVNSKWDYDLCYINAGNDMYPRINHNKYDYPDNRYVNFESSMAHKASSILFSSEKGVRGSRDFDKSVERYFDHAYGENSIYNDLFDIHDYFTLAMKELSKDESDSVFARYKFSAYNDPYFDTSYWHFDYSYINRYDGMIYFTDQGTEFCQVSDEYNSSSFKALGESKRLELSDICDEQIKSSGFRIKPGEMVLFNYNNAFHRAPYFEKTRSYFRFRIT